MSGFDPQVPGYDPEHRQQNYRRATRLKRRRLAAGIAFAALALALAAFVVYTVVPGSGERLRNGAPASRSTSTASPSTTTTTNRSAPPTTSANSLTAIKGRLAALTAGMERTLVPVPGGYQAATYNQSGVIDFWDFQAGRWSEVGTSSYLTTFPWHGYPKVTGALLEGMSNATFLAGGAFTGDSTGNFIIYGDGPNGWGVLVPGPNSTLIPTGKGVSGTRPDSLPASLRGALQLSVTLDDGQLATTALNPYFDNAVGSVYGLHIVWHGEGSQFTANQTNIFTASRASQPVGGEPALPADCSALSGTYRASFQASLPTPGAGTTIPFAVVLKLSPASGGAPPSCSVPVNANAPVAVQVTTNTGGTEWITAPLWVLTSTLLTSGPTHPSLTSLAAYPTSAANGYPGAPYYLPAGLDAASLLSSGADTSADVTFHGGQVTAVGILP